MKTCVAVVFAVLVLSAVQGGLADSNNHVGAFNTLERGPHHKVIAAVRLVTNSVGGVEVLTNRVTIVANGLHRRQGEAWADASPTLVKSNAAFYYVGAAFEARFPATLNSEALQIRMPDGERLEMTVIGLAYFDWTLQTNVLIGGIIEKPAAIVESNQVAYADCFDDVRGDVIYRCEKGAIRQNINVREQLPPPEAWGLNATSTFLVVLSEIHQGPRAQIRKKSFPSLAGVLADEDIRIGSMRFIPGEAFLKFNGKQEKGTRVAKQHSEIKGRKILFEKVPLTNIRSQLQQLPPAGGFSTNSSTAGVTNSSTAHKKRFFAAGSLPEPERLVGKSRRQQLAWLPDSQTSFVIDWDLVVNADQMNFNNGTYIVDGDVYVYDGYFSPDAVIKYTRESSLHLDTFHWNGSGEERAIMTSINDTSVGDSADEYQDWESPYDGEYGPALIVDAADLSLAQSKFHVYYASPGIIAEPCYVTVTALDKSADKNTVGDTASFRIQRSLTDGVLTVYYSTSGAAQAGTDYQALPGAVTFATGQSATNIVVTPLQTHNISFSRLNLVLTASGQYVLGTESSAWVCIRDSSLPAPPLLINMDLATDDSPETGPAAIGHSASDYWNAMHSSYSQWSISNNLHNASYVQTSISCTLSNTPGSWGFSCPDSMQGNYVYRSSGPAFMVLSNVPAGFYDLYLYSHDGNYDLTAGAQGYGNRRARDWPVRLPFVWEEGVQYAAFRGFEVHAGEAVKVTLNAGIDGYSVLAGFQLMNLPPPSITTQPSDLTVNQGDNAGWNVVAKGALPLSYQWKRNGTIIQGATLSSFLIGNVQPSHAGGYSLTVSNVAGQVVSRTATLTVRTPPVIVTQPAGQAVAEGSSCTFAVGVTGTSPRQYQWQFQGTDIAGATGSSFLIQSAQTFRAGEYRVRVSNAAGSALSSSALLQVLLPPTITLQPTNVVANAGQEARFSVSVIGSPTLQYQWIHAETNLPGVTSSTLILPNVQARDAGNYKVRVWNGAGQQMSTNATLRLVSRPVIISQPQGVQTVEGGAISFSVVATSPLPMIYQWKKGGKRLSDGNGFSGSTSDTFHLAAATLQDVGLYTVEVTNADGTAVSAPAALTVCSSAATRWVDRVLARTWVRFDEYNEFADFSNHIRGSRPVPCSRDVEFVFDNPKVIVGYDLTVSLYGWESRHLEWYQKRRELNFGVDDNNSPCAGPPKRIQIYASANSGTGLTLVHDHTFSWMEWNIDLMQQVLQTRVQIPSQYFGSKGQPCSKVFIRLIDGCHAHLDLSLIERVQEETAIACDGPPVFLKQPSDQTVCLGGPVTLKASVEGSFPMRFRWMLNGKVIQGETSETLSIAAISPFSYGLYALEAMNRFGTVTSRWTSIAPSSGQTVRVSRLNDPEESCSDGVFEIHRNCNEGELLVAYSVTNLSRPVEGYETTVLLPDRNNSALVSIPASLGDPDDYIDLQLLPGNYSLDTNPVARMRIQHRAPLIRPGFDSDQLLPNDDGSSPLVSLGFPVHLGRFDFFESLFVNNNGNVTFNTALGAYTPDDLTAFENIIAPLWADVDTRKVGTVKFGRGEVNGRRAFGVTWTNVGYYQMKDDRTNTFQLLLIDRSDIDYGDFDIEFNFERIQWETGEASEGKNGVGGVPVRVGFYLGADFFEIPGSGSPGKLIDGGPNALVSGSHGGCAVGRYVYQIRAGSAALAPVEFSPPWTNVLPVTVSMAIPDRPSATIRYTVDGSLPTQFSTLYSGPVDVLTNTQIRARGFAPDMQPSSITSGVYGDASPCPEGIIAWWPGDGNLADRTGRHNGLCMTPGEGVFAPKFDSGVVGQAFRFDASSGAIIRTPEIPVNATSFTIEGWFNSSSSLGGCIFERTASGSMHYAVTLGGVGRGHEQSIEFRVNQAEKVSGKVLIGQWMHFAAACAELDANRHAIQLYLNGVLASEVIATNLNMNPAPGCFVLGSRVDGTERFYGLVDEISVYSRALFPAEISYICQSAKGKLPPPVSDGLLAHSVVFEPSPSGGNLTAGDRAGFGVLAEGANLSYYWKRDGIDVLSSCPGWDPHRAPFLVFENCTLADAGEYSVTVSNQFGITNLLGLTLGVVPSTLKIVREPQDQAVYAGDSVGFTVLAVGSAGLTYAWQHDGVPIAGATKSSLNIPLVQGGHAGIYKVVVGAGIETVDSQGATLYVNPVRPPTIFRQPMDQTVYAGQSATLAVSANGTAPLSYQWYQDGEPLYGETRQILTLIPAATRSYLKVRVLNSAGEAESRNALIIVTNTGPSPFIVESLASQTNAVGQLAITHKF